MAKFRKLAVKRLALYIRYQTAFLKKTVQTAKRLLTKALKTNRGPYLSILEYRNTPIGPEGSPAQLLMGRRLRELIPLTNKQLQPETVRPSFVRRQFVQTCQTLLRNAKPLRPLQKGDCVYHLVGKTWEPAMVVGKPTTRSYDIKTEQGSTYRRNRRQLSFNMPVINDSDVADNLAEPLNNPPVTSRQSIASPYVTRSGRASKPPDRSMYQ